VETIGPYWDLCSTRSKSVVVQVLGVWHMIAWIAQLSEITVRY